MSKKPVFTGSAVAIVTPFDAEGRVDFDALGKLIDRQIDAGTDAIVICGTTGESPTLNDEEHRDCITYAVKRVNHRVPVISGTGSNDTAYAVSLSRHAQECGVDGLLMVTPYYNKTTQKGLVAHYTAVADSVDLPIILYNVPSRTGLNIKPETYYALSKHPNINGVKEANGDLSSVAHTRSLCGDDLFVWSGNDDQTVPIMSLGGKGVISTFANVLPAEMHQICAHALAGDFATAAKLQLRYHALMDALFIETNPIPVKTALRLMGFPVGGLRLPLVEMEEGNLAKLKKAMAEAGIL